MLELELDGRAALLAGAGAGIGRACGRALVEAGARVACADVDASAAEQLAAELVAEGGDAFAIEADLRNRAEVERAVATTAERFDGVDVLVDVIGEARWNRVLELTDADWDESFDLVLRHAFLLAQLAGRRMRDQGRGGAIVMVSSVSGLHAAPLHAAYGAAKAGMIALVQTLAVELAAFGIRVNAVAPGSVRTPRVLAMLTPERQRESGKSIPLGRMAEPDDIASAVTFLASSLAGYVTGQTLVVDGGATAQFPLSLRA